MNVREECRLVTLEGAFQSKSRVKTAPYTHTLIGFANFVSNTGRIGYD